MGRRLLACALVLALEVPAASPLFASGRNVRLFRTQGNGKGVQGSIVFPETPGARVSGFENAGSEKIGVVEDPFEIEAVGHEGDGVLGIGEKTAVFRREGDAEIEIADSGVSRAVSESSGRPAKIAWGREKQEGQDVDASFPGFRSELERRKGRGGGSDAQVLRDMARSMFGVSRVAETAGRTQFDGAPNSINRHGAPNSDKVFKSPFQDPHFERGKVWIGGFGPYTNVPYNPTSELAEHLDGKSIVVRQHGSNEGGLTYEISEDPNPRNEDGLVRAVYEIVGETLPVEENEAGRQVTDGIARERPDVALVLSLKGEGPYFEIETVASNELDASGGKVPREGAKVPTKRISKKGPIGLVSNLRAGVMVDSLKQEGFSAVRSSRGRIEITNLVFYKALEAVRGQGSGALTTMVGIPAAEEHSEGVEALEGIAVAPLASLKRGAEALARLLVREHFERPLAGIAEPNESWSEDGPEIPFLEDSGPRSLQARKKFSSFGVMAALVGGLVLSLTGGMVLLQETTLALGLIGGLGLGALIFARGLSWIGKVRWIREWKWLKRWKGISGWSHVLEAAKNRHREERKGADGKAIPNIPSNVDLKSPAFERFDQTLHFLMGRMGLVKRDPEKDDAWVPDETRFPSIYVHNRSQLQGFSRRANAFHGFFVSNGKPNDFLFKVGEFLKQSKNLPVIKTEGRARRTLSKQMLEDLGPLAEALAFLVAEGEHGRGFDWEGHLESFMGLPEEDRRAAVEKILEEGFPLGAIEHFAEQVQMRAFLLFAAENGVSGEDFDRLVEFLGKRESMRQIQAIEGYRQGFNSGDVGSFGYRFDRQAALVFDSDALLPRFGRPVDWEGVGGVAMHESGHLKDGDHIWNSFRDYWIPRVQHGLGLFAATGLILGLLQGFGVPLDVAFLAGLLPLVFGARGWVSPSYEEPGGWIDHVGKKRSFFRGNGSWKTHLVYRAGITFGLGVVVPVLFAADLLGGGPALLLGGWVMSLAAGLPAISKSHANELIADYHMAKIMGRSVAEQVLLHFANGTAGITHPDVRDRIKEIHKQKL